MRQHQVLIVLLSAICALSFAAPPASSVRRAEPVIRWHGQDYEYGTLPDEMPGAGKQAIEAWYEFAREKGYRMDLDDEGRVLLVSRRKSKQYGRQMMYIQRVVELFDAALPPPERRIEQEKAAPPPKPSTPTGDAGDDPLPEDPEDDGSHPWDDVDWGEEEGYTYTYTTYEWGAGGVPPDTETIVFLVAHHLDDYQAGLDYLGEQYDYLEDWLGQAKAQTGFALAEPLAGSYIELGVDGLEEWNPLNELVNRMARLLLMRRFGMLPYWMQLGWAWYAEMEVLDSIYVFPYRDEFVGVGEHTDWDRSLRYLLKRKQHKKGIELSKFADWRPGAYFDDKAKFAWGVVDYLVRERKQVLPGMLEALRAHRDEKNRVVLDENTWVRSTEYEIPVDEQELIMNQFLGKTFWKEATAFCVEKR